MSFLHAHQAGDAQAPPAEHKSEGRQYQAKAKVHPAHRGTRNRKVGATSPTQSRERSATR